MKLIDSAIGAGVAAKQASRAREFAKKEQEARLKLIEQMDFEPMYASDTTPTFQRTQSPVARSYLESFLMGSNPNATFSGSPNAKEVKANQQMMENATFGTPQARVQRQQEILQETPWKVTTPTRPVRTEADKTTEWSMANPKLAKAGYTPENIAELKKRGMPEGAEKSAMALAYYDKALGPVGKPDMLRQF